MPGNIKIGADDDDDPKSTRHSDDPEFQRLWQMKFSELEAIERDPEHPLHQKALIVGREMLAPMAKAFEVSSRVTRAALSEGLGEYWRAALQPAIDASRFLEQKYTPGMMQIGEQLARAVKDMPAVGAIDMPRAPTSVDFSSNERPDATVAEVHDAAESVVVQRLSAMLDVAVKGLEHQQERSVVDDERARAQGQRDLLLDARHRDSTKLTRSGVTGGWVAALLSGMGIIVAIVIAMWPKGS